MVPESRAAKKLLDMDRYQWTVLFAAWLGWGFDVFDGLLFNYVAPNCVPTLVGVPLGTPEAKSATLLWTGILTSLLLVGWGIGGIIFGRIADKIGRTKTLMLTMLLYALGTALCAAAPNIWWLIPCRFIASLGIGGEWAAGASMVAEVVPEKRRVEAGAILYTSAPMGIMLAGFVTHFIQGSVLPGSPETAWRWVFLCGLIPAAVAFLVRRFVKEPEAWKAEGQGSHPRVSELFSPEFKKTTLSGLGMAVVALIMWWSCNAFINVIAAAMASGEAKSLVLGKPETQRMVEDWKILATNCFAFGGLIGTMLTVWFAKNLGRKPMYIIYFAASAVALFCTFGLPIEPHTRLYMYFFIGLTIFGVFGSFTYYLPELFPTRLRATGAGFCYNAGRFVAALGPFAVGKVASLGERTLETALRTQLWIAVVPLLGLLLMPWVVETREKAAIMDS